MFYLTGFQNSSESMNVLETDYLHQLSSLAATYLGQHNSIPAFLAALTLKLFTQQTGLTSDDFSA